jgi:hypothetical protein
MVQQIPEAMSEQETYDSVRIIGLADVIGLVVEEEQPDTPRLPDAAAAAMLAFSEAGVARVEARMATSSPHQRELKVSRAWAAIEHSPLPEHEWKPIAAILGDDFLASLLGISVSSVHRYARGDRSTPDDVAQRLHFIALIVSQLAGSYNHFGIRRWFQRKRKALNGSSPADLLLAPWFPDDNGPVAVRDLASTLIGSPAA